MPDNNFTKALPSPADDQSGRSLPVPADMFRVPPYGVELAAEEVSVPLSHYLWILRQHAWRILGFVAIAVAATLVFSQRLTPIYEATATVDIDRQMPAGIIGQDANRAVMNDADQFLATQVKLIQSDSVLRPVADRYQLREREKVFAGSEPPGGVPVQEAPVLLKRLKVSRPPNTYLVLISYRSPDPRLAANVANSVARSYLEHTYTIRFQSSASLSQFMEKQLEELKAKMERSSAALAQFEKDLSVINPEEKTSILSARLLQLNTEYTNAQTDRVRKETAFNSVESGTLEAAQVSSQGESLKRLSERLDEAQQRFADVKTHYAENHPEYRKAAAQVAEIQHQLQQSKENIKQRVAVEYNDALRREAMLNKTVMETKAEFDRLNARSFEYQALKHEAEADKKLYEELIQKIKEAGINAGFQNSAIRIADLARPPVKPVFPNIPLNLSLAFLFSSVIAVGAAILGDMLNRSVRDPDQVSRLARTEVVGILPVAKELRVRLSTAPANGNGNGNGARSLVLAGDSGKASLTGYDEAIRTLRNSIFLTDFDRRLRSVMISSPSPAEGKSTIAAHLAVAHARQGRKTLVIDADLRRPSLHRHFAVPNSVGLSRVLNGETNWKDALVASKEHPDLDVLPSGPPSRRAADLIGGDLVEILEAASKMYDLVILDTPPLLGFSEPLQIANAVDGVVLVALAGQTDRKALATAVNTLGRLRANLLGVVLNAVNANTSEGYYYHYYHSKYYKHYESSKPAEA